MRASLVPLLLVLASSMACTSRRHDAPLSGAASDVLPARDASTPERELEEASLAAQAEAGLAPVLGVPRTKSPIRPTGHFNVKIWGSSANTYTLLDGEGRGAVPVTQARFLWGNGRLYVFVSAADLDLQMHAAKHDGPVWKDDSVALTFFSPDSANSSGRTKRIVQISAKGIVADGECPRDAIDLADPRCDLSWESGARAAATYDGTVNKVGDFDEEWTVEAAVPLASLWLGDAGPAARVRMRVSRCEVAYDGVRACGYWGDAREGGLLVLEDRE
jgi:hypothetical protein